MTLILVIIHIESKPEVWETREEIIKNIDGSYSADPKVEIEEFTQFFGLKMDPLIIDAETLGGLIINELGVLPKVGDMVKIENLNIQVTHADGRKITKVLITIA